MAQTKAVETRQRILDTAQAVIASNDGSLVNMSEIAGASGLSRQALYQHFSSRTELLMATMREIDLSLNLSDLLQPMQSAADGPARLDAFITFWGHYLPEFAGAARSLRAASREDESAHHAWEERMSALRHSCATTVSQIAKENRLALDWTCESATAVLVSMLSFDAWDHLVNDCGWSTETYVDTMKILTKRALIRADTL